MKFDLTNNLRQGCLEARFSGDRSSIDDQGKPVVGAIVRGRFVNDERSAVSQEDGSYRLQGCTPGRARIVVSAKRYATDMKLVEVSANATTCDFELQPGGRIRIRVMDEEGKPVPRARIFFQEWRGRLSTGSLIM